MSSVNHPVFAKLSMQSLDPDSFDREIEKFQNEIVGVFFWGHDCPNCEVAKAMLSQESDSVAALGIKWFHVNTYDHFELGTRFGLFGIPTFLFFYQRKKLGKISPFPGIVPFTDALRELRSRYRLE